MKKRRIRYRSRTKAEELVALLHNWSKAEICLGLAARLKELARPGAAHGQYAGTAGKRTGYIMRSDRHIDSHPGKTYKEIGSATGLTNHH